MIGSPGSKLRNQAASAWLAWYEEAGVTDTLSPSRVPPENPGGSFMPKEPGLAFSQSLKTSRQPVLASSGRNGPVRDASEEPVRAQPSGSGGRPVSSESLSLRQQIYACSSMQELRTFLEKFDGCALKKTATSLCFGDGNDRASLMIVGEAPGAEEDRQGRPFVGTSGKLLDRMLASIGHDRTSVWITNVIFWRPPGNRKPSTNEIEICRPFLEQQIHLMQPRSMLFLGSTAAHALLGKSEGVTRLRGRFYDYHPPERPHLAANLPIPAMVTFHPAYLLRQPLQKKLAWRDLLLWQSTLAADRP